MQGQQCGAKIVAIGEAREFGYTRYGFHHGCSLLSATRPPVGWSYIPMEIDQSRLALPWVLYSIARIYYRPGFQAGEGYNSPGNFGTTLRVHE